MSQNVPESKIARAKVASTAALKLGISELGHKVKRSFMSRENGEETKQKLDEKNAAILFNALTQLRGTALKLAQMIGMELDLLPSSYAKELQKSFHQVPPLNRVLIRKIMVKELGKPVEKLFKTYSPKAFAAASLGQVHKAELFDGTKVAVKVQYPGIGAAIDSDLAMVRTLVSRLRDAKIILQSLQEIEARLQEEVDYRIESRNTRWFAAHQTLEHIHIPAVHDQHSARHVLTTQYLDGMHLEEWLATHPTQDQRNKAAQLLYDFFVHSARDLQCLHADPNPGNYLFRADGSLGIIDFGCVRHLSDHFMQVFPQLLRAYLDGDREILLQAYEDIGMPFADLSSDHHEKLLRPFAAWVSEPFLQNSFDFGQNSDYTKRGQELMRQFAKTLDTPDFLVDEFVFFNRTTYGLCKIFERMGASVRLRHHWITKEK